MKFTDVFPDFSEHPEKQYLIRGPVRDGFPNGSVAVRSAAQLRQLANIFVQERSRGVLWAWAPIDELLPLLSSLGTEVAVTDSSAAEKFKAARESLEETERAAQRLENDCEALRVQLQVAREKLQ